MVAVSFYIVADTFFIAQVLGADGLAALNFAIPIVNVVNGLGLMLGMGAGIKYMIYSSQSDVGRATDTLNKAMKLSLVMGLLGVVVGVFAPESIARILGASGSVLGMTTTYIRYIFIFTPAFMIKHILVCVVRNEGRPGLGMLSMVVASLANIVLDYVFMYPLKWGMYGAVIATCIAPLISIAITLPFISKRREIFKKGESLPSAEIVLGIFSAGFPSLVAELSSGVVIVVFNILVLGLTSNVGVAAYGIIANLSLIVIAIYTGIAQGVQPLFSKNYGLGRRRDLRKIIWLSMISILALSAVVYGIVYFAAEELTLIFNSENNMTLQEIAVKGLRIYFTGCIFAGLNILASVYFPSVDNPKPGHLVSILRGMVIIIPAAVMLSNAIGVVGVWASFPITEFIVSLVVIVILIVDRKRKNNI